MPNYVSLTESQRRKIAVFITESQQQAQLLQQQQLQASNGGDDSVLVGSPGGSSPVAPITGNNSISCKEIVQFCKTRFGLTISLSTASRLRSSATERLATELLNPSAKRHRAVKFPEFEKALVQELKALEQEQLQIQQEQERQNTDGSMSSFGDPSQLPPVMTLTSEAAITQVAKGIAERMGIPVTELGLTSGWYHGFKRRHGIKHRQIKSRSGVNGGGGSPAASGSASTMDSISGSGIGETGDASDGAEGGDGDKEMEDVDADNKGEGDAGSNTSGPSYLKDQLNISNIVLTPKEPPASSLRNRPEVKKVTAATANDALDVISEYLLQNGQIGATKLPLVKELRRFLLVQTEAENGAANNNGLLLGGVPSLVSGTSNPDSAPVFVHNSSTISTLVNPELPSVSSMSLTGPTPPSGPGIVQVLGNAQSSLDLPADGLRAMEEVLTSHQQAQQHMQQHQV
ncbi:hypothetical protein BC939DRAFT_214835 [Gamsiella multidivaricata]|uniref:uncharacterized protein n=1 Tax=Gamsiella multidivaricata TaxID=101098 RepID=UPI00221F7ABB|nr:uncharacterized protein BC939DRAFT_214835 [Gamsiella multidivaricata]KAI7820978.1 hypothetical protein BC939DRAFT_214835 [Gamsiella multidivaricata]